MSSVNEIKEILYSRIDEFKNVVINQCNDEENKIKIDTVFKDIWFSKIMMFIILINDNKMDEQIHEFINKFNLKDDEEWKNKIKDYYKYFLEVKKIFYN